LTLYRSFESLYYCIVSFPETIGSFR